MDNCRVIGISGVAKSGKDQFFRLLKQKLEKAGVETHRYAIADRLKEELRNFIGWYYEFDLMSCSPEQKEDMRPLMVFHGTHMRKMTKGRHWVDFLSRQIERDEPKGVVCITDVRFDQQDIDEVDWLKNELGGKLVHISRYTELKDTGVLNHITSGVVANARSYVKPANEFEEANDPKLKEKADYRIEWPTVYGSLEDVDQELSKHVDDFWEWFTND